MPQSRRDWIANPMGMRILKWLAPVLFAAMELANSARAQTLPGGFAYLGDIDPTILQDIRYAGANNFVGRPLAATAPPNAW